MGSQSLPRQSAFIFISSALLIFLHDAAAEGHSTRQASNKIDVNDGKLKRQNEGGGGDGGGGGGEEVDLAPATPNQPGASGAVPGQSPVFINGNGGPFLQQQPFFGNGFGFAGQQGGFPGQAAYPGTQNGFPIQQGGYPGQGTAFFGQQGGVPGVQQPGFAAGYPQGFPQGFSQGYPQQGYPQFGYPAGGAGRNVILQNNGKQYLVQELAEAQRVVQKNGKQYLLQPLTGANAVGTGALNGIRTLNVPNAAFTGLSSLFNPNGALGSLDPSLASGANVGLPTQFLANGYPQAASGKLTSSAPQRVILNGNGQKFEVEQIPVRPSQYIGAVSAQLAAQASGQPYANQFLPFGLGNAGLAQTYARANEAGYGFYPSSQGPTKRGAKGVSSEERRKN